MATKRATCEAREFGRYIVADPKICHGKLTIRGTRILVADILEQAENGDDWARIVYLWEGQVPREAISEAVRLAKECFVASATRSGAPSTRRRAS